MGKPPTVKSENTDSLLQTTTQVKVVHLELYDVKVPLQVTCAASHFREYPHLLQIGLVGGTVLRIRGLVRANDRLFDKSRQSGSNFRRQFALVIVISFDKTNSAARESIASAAAEAASRGSSVLPIASNAAAALAMTTSRCGPGSAAKIC